jgi:magnesium chelatase subunit H
MLYGFPPNVGAVGTAALLDVPKSLENILMRLHMEGYDVGDFATDADSSGERLIQYSLLNHFLFRVRQIVLT